MKEIKIFIPEELKIDLENSNENEIYIVYKNENLINDEDLITINGIIYRFIEDDCGCKKCEMPKNYSCNDIKCTSSQRKDKKEGCFKIINKIC